MERKELLTVVLIGLLLVTVIIQTMQLFTLGNAQVVVPSTATSTVAAKSGPGGQGGASGGGGSNLANLPQMVGGC